jgi:hypothetical protein
MWRFVGHARRHCALAEELFGYPDALPILLEHLGRPYPDRVREGIARALAVRDAKFGWEALTRVYRHEEAGTDAKDGLAAAIAAVADDEVIDQVIGLARDATHGDSRLLLLRALARSKDPGRARRNRTSRRILRLPKRHGGFSAEVGEAPTQLGTRWGHLARATITKSLLILEGADRNRTGVHGFAGRCVATPPRRRSGPSVAAGELSVGLHRE